MNKIIRITINQALKEIMHTHKYAELTQFVVLLNGGDFTKFYTTNRQLKV